MSSMIWLVLSDVRLNGGFWPKDIGQSVSEAFGAKTNSGATGTSVVQHELTWIAVAVRLAVLLVCGALISGVVACVRPSYDPGKRARRRFESAFQSAMFLISRPWCFAGGWLIVWFIATSITNLALSNFLLFATPLIAALIVASSMNGFWNSFVRTTGQSSIEQSAPQVSVRYGKELLIVLLAAVGWEATSFWMNERLYAGLLVPHGDSAMYEEHLWNVWHGKGFRSYLDQGLFLGEHIQVIHLLLLPLHKIWPSYLMMELMASSSLAVCAVPVFSIAKRHSGSSKAAMWLALAWLLFFPMHFLDIAIDLKTLRPSCYGLPFLFWGIDFAERRRLVVSSLCFLIALTTQEDFALVVGSIGAVLFLTSKKKDETASAVGERRLTLWSLGLILFSVAWVLLAVLVVIPAFRGGEAVHYSRYFGDLGNSPGDLFRTALRFPGKVLGQLFSLRTLYYGLVLTVPIGFIPWRRPVYLLAGVATFCMLSLIQLSNSSESVDATGLSELPPIPFHHFHAPLLPVLFWAAAVSLAGTNDLRWRAARRQLPVTSSLLSSKTHNAVSAARLAFFCAACTAVSGSLMPIGGSFWSKDSPFGWRKLYVPSERAAAFEKIMASLPENSRIASTDYVHTRLTHYERSYDYSGYLRAVNDYKPGVPADTDYIVIDTGHRYSEIKSPEQVRELIDEPDDWEVVPNDSHGLFIVLRRATDNVK